MDSKNSLKLIFLVFTFFVLHLFFYYFFPAYGDYFKNIKYNGKVNNGEIIENNNELINNNINNGTNKKISSYTGSNFIIPDINEEIVNDKNNNNIVKEYNVIDEDTSKDADIEEENIDDENLTDNEENVEQNDTTSINEVLDLFNDFDLEKKDTSSTTSIFGLTNEYPYKFDEYYSKEKKLSIYVFKEKKYEDILNLFDVISYNLYFKTKKVNNFGEKSFYINLEPDLDDSYIRLVFLYKNNNFGLKIKKDGYNEVKTILKSISIK